MGLFNFFKKLKKQEKTKIINLDFKNLPEYIQSESEKNNSEKQTVLKQLNKLISTEIQELIQKSEELGNIDFSKKKAEARVLHIVKENLSNYTYYVNRFINNMEEINKNSEDSTDLIKRLNTNFLEFQQKSKLSFEKATYLVGELGTIQESLNKCFKSLDNLIKENKEIFETSETLDKVTKKLSKLLELDNLKSEIKETNNKTKIHIQKKELEIKKLNREIEEIKNSKEFKKEVKSKESIDKKEQEYKKQVYKLRDLIDFKILANISHQNEKEMQIIKNHKSNFLEAFQKDNQQIINLINSTSQLENKFQIKEEFEKTIELSKNIKTLEGNLELKSNAEIVIKDSEINRLNQEIEILNQDIERENKRSEKLEVVKEELKEGLKEESLRIGVEIEV